MKLRTRLTLIVTAMMVALITISSVIIFREASVLQTSTTYDYAEELSNSQAIDIQRRIENYTDVAKTLSQVFGDYKGLNENIRRSNYDDLLHSIVSRFDEILGVWTAWFPNTIDSYDAQLGQYQTYYTKRTGPLIHVEAGYDGWQNYLANATDKPAIASPIWRDTAGHGNVPIVSVMYPIMDGGKVLGLVGINYISSLQATVDEIVKKVYDGKGGAGVYANDGTIVAHYDLKRVKDNIKNNETEKTLLGSNLDRVVQSIRNGGENGKAVTLIRYSPVWKTDMYFIYEPIAVSEMTTPWCLMVAIPLREINRPLQNLMRFTIIITAILIVAAAIIVFIVARGIVMPIAGVTRTLKDISEGEGDLTRTIPVKGNDEVSHLSLYFNKTLEKIRSLIVLIKNETVTLHGIGDELADNMTSTAAAVNEITANIQSIKSRILNQNACVSETNATMEKMTDNIGKLHNYVDRQTGSVSQSSAAIEQMLANIESVTHTLAKNAKNMDELTSASDVGRSGLQDVAADIQEISRESAGLLEINSVMENIASQTNLLSMNAAIEAAHAGEAGKGFAVVADEIRKLAESSSEQSKTISTVLNKMKGAVDKITSSTDNVLKNFEAIDSRVKVVADQDENIHNAMEEQNEGSKQILEAVAQLNEVTQLVKDEALEMNDGSREVIREGKSLEMITEEITSGMSEMTIGVEQINDSMSQISEICVQNKQSIDHLVHEVSRFKVE